MPQFIVKSGLIEVSDISDEPDMDDAMGIKYIHVRRELAYMRGPHT